MKPETPPEIREELLDDFYAECDEHLANIREALALLEQSVGKAQADPRVLEELFRNFHSFKGISALVGLRTAEELAHAAEDFLRELSRGRASLTLSGLELLMGATQKLEQTVSAFRSRGPLPDIGPLMRSLRAIAGMDSGAKTEASGQGGRDSEIEDGRARGLVLWQCVFVPTRELDERGININSVRARLTAAGEILRVAPKVRGQGVVAFEFLLGTRETPGDIANWESDGITVELMEHNPEASSVDPADTAAAEPAHSPFIAPSHVVRVDLNKLDDLMRITGEMVIQRSRFDEQLRQAERSSTAISLENFQEVNSRMAR
ncbi:MAG: Hpt domain-containing protein [Limisphaerales bacterium]